MAKQRDYKREYEMYQGTTEQKRNRAKRNAARREMEREVGKSALKGKDVDHKIPLSRGGGNSRSNLQITSVHYNRSVKDKKSKK